jgi:hypothetical protein
VANAQPHADANAAHARDAAHKPAAPPVLTAKKRTGLPSAPVTDNPY